MNPPSARQMHKPGVAASKTERALTRSGAAAAPRTVPARTSPACRARESRSAAAAGTGRARERLLRGRSASEARRTPGRAGRGGREGRGGEADRTSACVGKRSGGAAAPVRWRAGPMAHPSAPLPRRSPRSSCWRRRRRAAAGRVVRRAAGSAWPAAPPAPAAGRTRDGPWGPAPPSGAPARRSTAERRPVRRTRPDARPERTPDRPPRLPCSHRRRGRAAERRRSSTASDRRGNPVGGPGRSGYA